MEIWHRNNKKLAFFPETLNSFEINDYTNKILTLLNFGATDGEIMKQTDSSKKEFEKVKKLFLKNKSEHLKPDNLINVRPNYLRRLSINISNTCNMKCKYCYAKFGSYGSEESMMNLNILKVTLDKFYNAFDEIGVLQVFGGEPFLNIKGFQYICEYIEKRYREGKIKYKTLITTVTNGTVLSSKILDLIKTYDICVTVSLDGPKSVQNENRIFLNGTGTFGEVVHNINWMKRETGQPKQIEMTYSQTHVNNHVSILDLIKYVKNEFNNVSIHVAPVSADKKEDFALKNRNAFISSVDNVFQYNHIHRDKLNYLVLDSMIRSLEFPQKKTNFCDAGVDLFSVSCTGYIYPCYMFIGEPGFALMNVQDKDFSRSVLLRKTQKYRDYNRQTKECNKCPIVNVCEGCIGMNYYATGNIYKSPNEECNMKRKMVKNIMFNVVNVV